MPHHLLVKTTEHVNVPTLIAMTILFMIGNLNYVQFTSREVMVKESYLVNSKRVNIQVALGGDMAPGERLVVGDTEG